MSATGNITGNKMTLKNVRLSFPNLKEAGYPKGYEGEGEPKFSANFLLDPEDPINRPIIKALNAEVKRLQEEAWPDGIDPQDLEFKCFGKGERFRKRGERTCFDGYAGMYAVDAKNTKRPALYNAKGEILTPEEAEQVLYAGCYVNASVTFWAQRNKHGDAIRCSLNGIRFRSDGEQFGAGGVDADELGDGLDGGEIDLDDDDLGLD